MAAIDIAKAVPPALTKGRGTPVMGIKPTIELILKKAWKINQEIMPTATSLPKFESEFCAIFSPRYIKKIKKMINKAEKINPISSAMIAKIESPVTSGR